MMAAAGSGVTGREAGESERDFERWRSISSDPGAAEVPAASERATASVMGVRIVVQEFKKLKRDWLLA